MVTSNARYRLSCSHMNYQYPSSMLYEGGDEVVLVDNFLSLNKVYLSPEDTIDRMFHSEL